MSTYLLLGSKSANGQYNATLNAFQLKTQPIESLSQASLQANDVVIVDPNVVPESTIRQIVDAAHSAHAKVLALYPNSGEADSLTSIGVDKVQARGEMAYMRIAQDAKRLAGLGL